MLTENMLKQFPHIVIAYANIFSEFGDDELGLMKNWCLENCKGEFYHAALVGLWYFKEERDSTLFRIFWSHRIHND